jgi:hypothetical protein
MLGVARTCAVVIVVGKFLVCFTLSVSDFKSFVMAIPANIVSEQNISIYELQFF